jgi:hypothetical protein
MTLEKIGYHLNFNFEYNTESGSKESLYSTGTPTLSIMAFPVVEFSRQGYKIRKVFG